MPPRSRDAIRAGKRDRIVRASSIHPPRVCCSARLDHVVDRVHRERTVVRHPEDSGAAANDGRWRQAVSHTDPGRKVILLKRKIVPCSRRRQVDIPFDCWRTLRKKLVQIAGRIGSEIREPVKTLGPWPLQFITESETDRQSVFDMPDVVEVEATIGLLARSECRDNRLGKEMVFKIAEVVRIP